MLSRSLRAPWWWQTFIAAAVAFAAFGLTLLLHLQERPFLLPMVGILVAALRGGLPAGIVCTAITVSLAKYFHLAAAEHFAAASVSEAYELGIVTLAGVAVTALVARPRRMQLALEATVASISDGVIVTNRAGQVTFLNAAAARLTGWTPAEAAGRNVHDVFSAVDERTREAVADPVERAMQRGVTASDRRVTLIARDGAERPVSESAAPIRDGKGPTIGAVLLFRDVSGERAAEEHLRQQAAERLVLLERERSAREDAERANRLKDEFLATLSHELRTPLNAVLGWAHMLTRRQLTSDQQKQALTAIHRNAQAQARLVDDVLDLSRIVTGRMAFIAEPVDLVEIARTTAEAFTPAVLAKQQDLTLELEATAEIVGDPHRLRQIVWNLLSNATKFTPEGGSIAVRVSTSGGRVDLSVADSGEGIDAAFLPFVFDRFRQADGSSTRGHGGLGLGLALVRHLVEAHGGSVTAASGGAGQGTTLQVSLPARTAAPGRRASHTGERADEVLRDS